MPKLLLLCHVALLVCLSLLAFPATVSVGPAPRGLAIAAAVLAALLFGTEVLSGLRWPAGVAALAAIVGLVAAPVVGAWAWGVAWAAVVAWFALLAQQARENR